MGAVAGLHGLDELVRLLDDVLQQRGVRLLRVPGTPARGPQPVHDSDQLEQRVARIAHGTTEPGRSLAPAA
jgi:hypothetical protein